MTTQAKFDLKGLDEYLDEIQQAGKDIDAAAQRALEKAAPILRDEMQVLVPVDEGNLYEHIKIRGPLQEGNVHIVEVGVIHQLDYTDAKTAEYGNVMEYGSPSKHIRAQPYIRPAIDRKRAAVRKAIRDSLKSEGMVD